MQFDRQFALREAFTEFEDSSSGLLDRLRRHVVDRLYEGFGARCRWPQKAEIKSKRRRVVGLRVLNHLVDDRLVVGFGDQPARAFGAPVRRAPSPPRVSRPRLAFGELHLVTLMGITAERLTPS